MARFGKSAPCRKACCAGRSCAAASISTRSCGASSATNGSRRPGRIEKGVGRGFQTDGAENPSRPLFQLWEALMHPGQRLGPGARVTFGGVPAEARSAKGGDAPVLRGEVVERRFHGRRVIRLWT